ncbi:Uncharacterized protein QJS10_CPB13g00057 [Acorus calamus]|uniref:S-adenosyl-L-methionine-dependent methyltransferase n=1 Tax=Acorus calamus TaxID=4465 RepID=A0AAV9DHH0_ACOCL|nr:Uncharacterized protein QJS10_CPB13g00057 [Acorus calamus]
MSRRPVNPARRFADSASVPFTSSLHSKSKSSPYLSSACLRWGASFSWGTPIVDQVGLFGGDKDGVSKIEGESSCTSDVQRAIPFLKKVYGNSMRKVLHVGPESCTVVSKLLNEEDTEAWGVEPYELEDADNACKILVRKGVVRVADIKFPLPYKPKSFSLVIVSDALDYLSPKYLNKTLPDLARVSMDGLVIFAGYPGKPRPKVSELPKFGRPIWNAQLICNADLLKWFLKAKLRSSSWWIRYFVQTGLEENELAMKKFEQAMSKRSYKPGCQVFHLSSYR